MSIIWRNGTDAPKDGRIILALHADLSGAYLARFGEFEGGKETAWFSADWTDEVSAPSFWCEYNPPGRKGMMRVQEAAISIIEAQWAEAQASESGESRFWEVGRPIWTGKGHGPTVTRITVQEDLPGLHCNMRRVCIWIGDTMVVEAPLHTLAVVGYSIPEGGAA